MKKMIISIMMLHTAIIIFSQDLQTVNKGEISNWTTHFQTTVIYQHQSAFRAKYSGQNSLDTTANEAYSQTATLFIGRRLWKNAVFYFNPEITGGDGISHVTGLAGAPNGEIYRVGNPKPTAFVARGYLQQIIPIGNTAYHEVEDGENQLSRMQPHSYISLIMGKFCVSDFFDDNLYSHDARSQFLNWAIMASGAWDFMADTRGYTTGIAAAIHRPNWTLGFASVRVPRLANGLEMDWNIAKANSETLEYEQKWSIHHRPGTIRATGYITFSKAPVYTKATQDLLKGDSTRYFVLMGEKEWNTYEGVKYGFGINLDQEIANGIGVFSRISWSDGHSGTWAFTEIDRNLQIGYSLDGKLWNRPADVFGMCAAVNGLSSEHRAYLKAGGMGFIIGDGNLNYGTEKILEAYYRAKLNNFLFVSVDYQFITNPGYNKDRKGPIYVPGVRVHVEF